ncbi:MAG: iron-containing alcohol dehydrogenase [Acidobacteriota bacterium]
MTVATLPEAPPTTAEDSAAPSTQESVPASTVPTLGSETWTTEVASIDVVFGDGVLERLGGLCRDFGGRRAMVVTDPGLMAAGHPQRAVGFLERAGLTAQVFDAVGENPTTEHVAAGLEMARSFGADVFVGLGGGSAMDCAKAVNLLLTNGGEMEDYWGFGKASKPLLPSVGVPATAGTGSEAQSFALISRASDHVKMACGDRKARFRVVLLDPEVVATAPREVAVLAAIDALSHAVESYVTIAGTPLSKALAREAWRYLPLALERWLGGQEEARREMLWGAHLAGAAIEQSMLGAAHSCANPLTASFDVPHGDAVGVMLPAVVRFNAQEPAVAAAYAELMASLPAASPLSTAAGKSPTEQLAQLIDGLRERAQRPRQLRELGVAANDLENLAQAASTQWTANFNPRPIGEDDFRELYAQTL